MTLPLTKDRGTVRIQLDQDLSNDELARVLAAKITAAGGTKVEVIADGVTFHGGLLRASGWSMMSAIGSGEITLKRAPASLDICYTIFFTELLAAVGALAIVAAATIAAMTREYVVAVFVFVVCLAWFHLANVFLARWRFRRLLRKSAH